MLLYARLPQFDCGPRAEQWKFINNNSEEHYNTILLLNRKNVLRFARHSNGVQTEESSIDEQLAAPRLFERGLQNGNSRYTRAVR